MAKKLPKKIQTKKKASPVDHTEDGVKSSVSVVNNKTKTEKMYKGAVIEEPEDNPALLDNKDKASVGLSKGYSYNLGNYESAKISAWITVPCENDEDIIMDTLGDISALLDEHLEFEANELDASLS